MSRIHEALRKAAEERASAAVAAEPVDRSAEKELAPQVASRELSAKLQEPALARFEELQKHFSHPVWKPDPRLNVFKDPDSEKSGAECFRTLRSRLHQIAATRPLKRLLITSSLPGEGKTFVAANLAQSIILQQDRRVLLIDADLRASRLHLAFGAPTTPGLTEYLRGEATEYEVIQNGSTENLCLIAGGGEAANPAELLLGERMKRLLDVVTPLFDFVILDSPPVIPVHDSNLLADLCDGTLFVVRAGVTDGDLALRGAAEFEKKNLLGVVLNGVGSEATYGGYYEGSYGGADRL